MVAPERLQLRKWGSGIMAKNWINLDNVPGFRYGPIYTQLALHINSRRPAMGLGGQSFSWVDFGADPTALDHEADGGITGGVRENCHDMIKQMLDEFIETIEETAAFLPPEGEIAPQWTNSDGSYPRSGSTEVGDFDTSDTTQWEAIIAAIRALVDDLRYHLQIEGIHNDNNLSEEAGRLGLLIDRYGTFRWPRPETWRDDGDPGGDPATCADYPWGGWKNTYAATPEDISDPLIGDGLPGPAQTLLHHMNVAGGVTQNSGGLDYGGWESRKGTNISKDDAGYGHPLYGNVKHQWYQIFAVVSIFDRDFHTPAGDIYDHCRPEFKFGGISKAQYEAYDADGLPPFSEIGSNYVSLGAYPNPDETIVQSSIVQGPTPVLSDGFLYYHGYGIMNAVEAYNACLIVGHAIQFGQHDPYGGTGGNQYSPGLNRWFVYDLDA